MTPALLLVMATMVQEAREVTQRWAVTTPSERGGLLSRAARVPWPLLPEAIDAELIISFGALETAARESFASDRAALLLEGEIAAPAEWAVPILEVAGAPYSSPLAEARAAYRAGQFERAADAYQSLPFASPLWGEAMTERAWAAWSAGDDAAALGASVALSSPYVAEPSQVEARLLEARVLIAKCRWQEAHEHVAALIAMPATSRHKVALRRVRAWLPEAASWPELNDRLVSLERRLDAEAGESDATATRRLVTRALALQYDAVRAGRQLEGLLVGPPEAPAPELLGDDEIAWTFTGVYWRDELSRYRRQLADLCPAGARP